MRKNRSRLGVSANVGSVCDSFKLKIDAEISVVPVIKIVPVSYGKFVARLVLSLVIPREGERGVQIHLDVCSLLEVWLSSEHVNNRLY